MGDDAAPGACLTDHIIFDLDGTLVDSVLHCAAIVTAMHAHRGSSVRICRDSALPYVSVGGPAMVAALLGDLCGDPEREILDFRARYATMPTPPDSLFPGVAEGLTGLRDAGFTLSICSNKPQNLCEKVLGDLGLAPLFGVIVGTVPGRRPKPAPDLLDLTLRQLNVGADRCLFVGDSRLDQDIARNVGMAFVRMTYGYAEADWPQDDDLFHHHFADLTADLLARRTLAPPVLAPAKARA